MGRFVKKCSFHLGPPGYFITSGDFVYQSFFYGTVTVPDKFKTDFASIPNLVPRWLFDPFRHARLSSLPHDFLCRFADNYEDRVKADHVFYEAMGDEGVKRWRQVTMFAAVRANTWRMKLVGKLK